VQCLVRLEALEGFAPASLVHAQEVLDENRFVAARDGTDAALIDPTVERRVPLAEVLEPMLEACAPHAAALGCEAELGLVRLLADEGGADRQRQLAGEEDDQERLVSVLSEAFSPVPVRA
jgi:carboxylate-amine ligase